MTEALESTSVYACGMTDKQACRRVPLQEIGTDPPFWADADKPMLVPFHARQMVEFRRNKFRQVRKWQSEALLLETSLELQPATCA